MSDVEQAEEFLRNRPRTEWCASRSMAYSLLSIAKSLEVLSDSARRWMYPPQIVVTDTPLVLQQCPEYTDEGGCYNPDGAGHDGNCMSKQVADQLDSKD